MHTIKANGGRLTIHHQRSHEEIQARPHITRWKGRDNDDKPIAMWAVYYLMGKQSRIRCNLHATLRGAIRQVNDIDRTNVTAIRNRIRRAA